MHPGGPKLRVFVVCFVLLFAALGPCQVSAWTTRATNSKFRVGTFFAHRWNVSLTISAEGVKRTHNAQWALKADDEGADELRGELEVLDAAGHVRKACRTLLDGTSDTTGRLVQVCGDSPPSVYELDFSRLDEQVLTSSGPVTREAEVTGVYHLTVSSPTHFTLTLTSTGDGAPTIRTLVCRRVEEGRSWTNRIVLGCLCAALVVSQIYVKRRMRTQLKPKRTTRPRAKQSTAPKKE